MLMLPGFSFMASQYFLVTRMRGYYELIDISVDS
jgi:hypothetical protein